MLLVGQLLGLVENLLLPESRAQHGLEIARRSSRALHCALERAIGCPGRHWSEVLFVGLFDLDGIIRSSLPDIAESKIRHLRLRHVVVRRWISKGVRRFARFDRRYNRCGLGELGRSRRLERWRSLTDVIRDGDGGYIWGRLRGHSLSG